MMTKSCKAVSRFEASDAFLIRRIGTNAQMPTRKVQSCALEESFGLLG